MKKFLIFFLTVVLLASCSNEIPEHHQPVQAKRTILAYLVANNNLDGDLMDNVKWMYESLATAKVFMNQQKQLLNDWNLLLVLN